MDIQQQGSNYLCTIIRGHIFDIWHKYCVKGLKNTEHSSLVLEEIQSSLPVRNKENYNIELLKTRVLYVCKKLAEFWKKHSANKERLIGGHSEWLGISETILLENIIELADSAQVTPSPSEMPSTVKRGRPRKAFAECSKRTKQRRVAELSLTDESMASTVSELSRTSSFDETVPTVSPKEVLSLVLEAKLTKHQYMLLKNFVNSKVKNIFPSYQNILAEKKKCYPDAEQTTVTESGAEVELQALLDHTATRLLESQKEVLSSISDHVSSRELTLIGKWGFDGTTGQSEYKQSFCDSNVDDSSLFVTSYVPLQLLVKNETDEIVVWKNPRPCSTRYCRPIRFQFKKETTEVSIEEERYFNEKISTLQPTKVTLEGETNDWIVNYNLQLTMVDGKVCNALSETSSQKCYLCGASPKEMNNLELCVGKPIHKDYLGFGLSPLHSWIRFFEYFLHVAYRLDIKKWQVRGQQDKDAYESRKKLIQAQFREKLGLLIDKPKPGGSGTSNDGNTARKFFSNPQISSQITGLDQNLIERCSTILQALTSGYKINKDKFQQFALETAKNIVEIYPWYYLPASVHKILVHGALVIEHHAIISIGELSEEAAEARNKDYKSFRLHHTRKISRVATNQDLLNRLLVSSDPLITGLRRLPVKKKSTLPKAVIELLLM